jgi:hypothetical protein
VLPDENIKVGIAMNEKIAGITFADLKGKIDFFTSSSVDFHRWCHDLFTLEQVKETISDVLNGSNILPSLTRQE